VQVPPRDCGISWACSGQKGLHTTPSKLTAIRNAPTPKNIRELRSFLGLINYYMRFLSNLSKRHNVKWNLSKQCDAAFTDVKNKLSAKVSLYYNPQEITLATDAFAYVLGAVLSHTTPLVDKPIAFASKTLSQAECNYSQIEKGSVHCVWCYKISQLKISQLPKNLYCIN
uniref:Reverse transcriptase/retrotransposon-derived protein RNase H-like domain-containing protein n=1 Tax=Amphimedon queenslandica TaxID=400682 RepID=A0A1X7V796_AMPQE